MLASARGREPHATFPAAVALGFSVAPRSLLWPEQPRQIINQLPAFLNRLLCTESKVTKHCPGCRFFQRAHSFAGRSPAGRDRAPPPPHKTPTYTQLKTTVEQAAPGNMEPPRPVREAETDRAWWGWSEERGRRAGTEPRSRSSEGGAPAGRSPGLGPLAKLTKLGKLTAQGGARSRLGNQALPPSLPRPGSRSPGEEGQGVFVNTWAPPLH